MIEFCFACLSAKCSCPTPLIRTISPVQLRDIRAGTMSKMYQEIFQSYAWASGPFTPGKMTAEGGRMPSTMNYEFVRRSDGQKTRTFRFPRSKPEVESLFL